MSRSRASAKAAGTRHERRCKGCAGPLPPQQLGQPRKWCSDSCRSETYMVARRRPRNHVPPAARVLSRSELTDGGCLEFQGCRNAGGYGVVSTWADQKSRSRLAHRVTWEAEKGPITDGMAVRHKCDNPPCVNTAHLELGSHQENMSDRDQRGRTRRGERGRHKLSWAQVQEIRALASSGIPHRQIAERFRVSTSHVSYIKNKKTRVHE